MLEGGIIAKLLDEKWSTFAKVHFPFAHFLRLNLYICTFVKVKPFCTLNLRIHTCQTYAHSQICLHRQNWFCPLSSARLYPDQLLAGVFHQAACHSHTPPDHRVDGRLPEAKHQVLPGERDQGGHRGHHHGGREQVSHIRGEHKNLT